MDIRTYLIEVPENTSAVISAKTAVKMNKKDVATKSIANPHGDIFKVSNIRVTLNASYQDRVNEQRKAEGNEETFVAQERRYGERIGNALLENNGTEYLTCIEEERLGATYIRADGTPIDYSEFSAFVPVYKSSNAHQGTVEEVRYRNFKLESILTLQVGDQIFTHTN